MAELDEIGDSDENFDKNMVDPKAKLGNKNDKDDEFEEKEDDLDDLDVVIEEAGTTKKNEQRNDKRQLRTEEKFGKRRHKPRESQLVRTLETQLNEQRLRNDRMEQRLNAVESNTSKISESSTDGQISEANRYLDQAKAAHAQAVKDGDGDAAAEALDVMMEAKETLILLKNTKATARTNSATTTTETKKPQGYDPAVIRMYSKWQSNNDWYDPATRDKCSLIAHRIDNTLVAEGYDPRTQEYWDELDDRLRENKTLQREIFSEDGDDSNEEDDEMEDTKDERKVMTRGSRRPAPQNDRSNSNGGGRKKVVVSAARADAMRQMGLQPGTTEWKRMAKRYESYDKQRKGAN